MFLYVLHRWRFVSVKQFKASKDQIIWEKYITSYIVFIIEFFSKFCCAEPNGSSTERCRKNDVNSSLKMAAGGVDKAVEPVRWAERHASASLR